MRLNYVLDVKTYFADPAIALQKLENLVGETVLTTGWFRRGNMPILDVSVIQPVTSDRHLKPLNSHHQLWNNFLSSIAVLVGLGLLAVTSLF